RELRSSSRQLCLTSNRFHHYCRPSQLNACAQPGGGLRPDPTYLLRLVDRQTNMSDLKRLPSGAGPADRCWILRFWQIAPRAEPRRVLASILLCRRNRVDVAAADSSHASDAVNIASGAAPRLQCADTTGSTTAALHAAEERISHEQTCRS